MYILTTVNCKQKLPNLPHVKCYHHFPPLIVTCYCTVAGVIVMKINSIPKNTNLKKMKNTKLIDRVNFRWNDSYGTLGHTECANFAGFNHTLPLWSGLIQIYFFRLTRRSLPVSISSVEPGVRFSIQIFCTLTRRIHVWQVIQVQLCTPACLKNAAQMSYSVIYTRNGLIGTPHLLLSEIAANSFHMDD